MSQRCAIGSSTMANRLVERSHLPVRRTLEKLGIPRTTFYRRYDRNRALGEAGLEDCRPHPGRVWTRIPDAVRRQIVGLALDEPELSAREPGGGRPGASKAPQDGSPAPPTWNHRLARPEPPLPAYQAARFREPGVGETMGQFKDEVLEIPGEVLGRQQPELLGAPLSPVTQLLPAWAELTANTAIWRTRCTSCGARAVQSGGSSTSPLRSSRFEAARR